MRILISLLFVLLSTAPSFSQNTIWSIGKKDNLPNEFALAPNGFRKFIANDFGFEDKFFLVGYSNEQKDFPYVLPGIMDNWAGSSSGSGWINHEVNILFGIEKQSSADFKLVIDLANYEKKYPALLKVSINNQTQKFQFEGSKGYIKPDRSPQIEEFWSKNMKSLVDTPLVDLRIFTGKSIEIPIKSAVLKKGGNCISLTLLEGAWIMFDDIRLEASDEVAVVVPKKLFVRDVKAVEYEIETDKKKFQPLLVDVEHLDGAPLLTVELDGQLIFKEKVEAGRYQFEAPMPAVKTSRQSRYKILVDGIIYAEGMIYRSSQPAQTSANYVDTRMGTAHSRWSCAPGPWMPFSMVKMSPDNQNFGWQAGYQPSFEYLGCISHIHEWTMAGLGMMPANGKLQTRMGDELNPGSGYRSRIDKQTEEAPIGFYKVHLSDYDIEAEVTATMRCGFQRYTFPANRDSARVLVDLHTPAEYDYELKQVEVRKVSDYRIEGFSHHRSPQVWSADETQEYTVHFVIEFDQPIRKMGTWRGDHDGEYEQSAVILDQKDPYRKVNHAIKYDNVLTGVNLKDAGVFLEFDVAKTTVVQARSAISYVSIENASQNLDTEVTKPFGWSFDAVRNNQLLAWNNLLARLTISTSNRLEKVRFYSNFYRALSAKNTMSDVNGEWISADKEVQHLKNPLDVMVGFDGYWNSFWNLNQLWNLATPEWSSRLVKTQLSMFQTNGWLAKGSPGLKYIPVMAAEHEIPQMISAYQMGIRNFDVEQLFQATKKMQTTPSQRVANGYAGNRDLSPYLRHHYVPSDSGRFSNTMEYSYDDWTVGQLAKAMGKESDYKIFNDRGNWWRNAIDPKDGYCHMRLSNGEFVPDFDPFRTGANHHYVEANAWQMTFFVPQDVPALAKLIGKQRFADRLEWGFKASEPFRFNAPNDEYWDYPVVQGNEQSMHFAFLFNWVGKPWLTQKWSRSILERHYGSGLGNAYLGDEDQGQMSSWCVMAAIGLFQTDGGCRVDPIYEIASPLFEKTEIDLGRQYGRGNKFIITAKGASRNNKYVQSAILNGKPLNSFFFQVKDLLSGGELILEMGNTPNGKWGVIN